MTITSAPTETRPPRQPARTVVLALLSLVALAWAAVRLFGWERGFGVQLMAFTPYAAAGAWVPLVLALTRRRWLSGAVALVAAGTLAVCVLPRALPDADPGPATGFGLTVMTLNLYVGDADAGSVVDLVREHDVAMLAVQEFTPAARRALTVAGLDALLPYQALAEEVGTTGSGLYSRFPLTRQGSLRGRGGNLQAYATIQAPGAVPVTVESAHPLAPYATAVLPDWRDDLAAEPTPNPDGLPRILLGDFNSTLDHQPVRALLARGYRDAADAVGKGLLPTWGPWGGRPVLPVTLDHVLVDNRLGVRDVQVHAVRRSDHRSVLATLTIPPV